MQKVIILGANGFIGSNLTQALSKKGVHVLALVDGRFDYQKISRLPQVSCVEFSLESLNDLSIKDIEDVDIIYHLAWEGVNAKLKNASEIQAQNIIYGIKVLNFAKQNGIKKVLIPGSAAEVSCGEGVITGKEPPSPSDMYSAAKVATRYLCQTYAKQNEIDLIWTLITSIYGPGRDTGDLISYTIKTILKNEVPSFTRLEQQWDYLYIDDLIDGLIALGEKGKGGKIYPMGSGENRRMVEYVDIIKNHINPSISLGIGDLPYKNPDKIDNQVMDITSLVKDTGFIPRYKFDEGIKITIKYFRDLNLT